MSFLCYAFNKLYASKQKTVGHYCGNMIYQSRIGYRLLREEISPHNYDFLLVFMDVRLTGVLGRIPEHCKVMAYGTRYNKQMPD
jgi:hypothetical protein